jgi:hypothetical protein
VSYFDDPFFSVENIEAERALDARLAREREARMERHAPEFRCDQCVYGREAVERAEDY